MFTVFHVCLLIILECGFVQGGKHNFNDLWSIKKSGDIIIHSIFPLRERASSRISQQRFVLNFEGIMWMGAMIRRISEINRGRSLPENLTIGFHIKDSSCDSDTGLKQTLSVLNKIINNDDNGNKRVFNFPAVVGPVCDRVESNSHKLFEMFDVPRISFTTTSSRFHYSAGRIIRTVPSDFVHVEAVLRFLEDMNAEQFSIVSTREQLWCKRANKLRVNMERRKMPVNNITYIDTTHTNFSLHLGSGQPQVVIVFTEANISRMLIKREKKPGLTWIVINKFDDPLYNVFDEAGNVSNKTIIRNARRNDFHHYKQYLVRTLKHTGGHRKKRNWLNIVLDKYTQQCRNQTPRSECNKEKFQEKFESYLQEIDKNFRSSLTLQGVTDAVDLVVNSVRDTLKTCAGRDLRLCLHSSANSGDWWKSLRETKVRSDGKEFGLNEHGTLTGNYSIRVLRRIKTVLGRRTRVTKGWTFKNVREWNITEDLSHIHEPSVEINGLPTAVMTADNMMNNNTEKGSSVDGKKAENCSHCNGATVPTCQSTTAAVLDWNDTWAIAVYLFQFFILCAVIISLAFFYKHKNSPIMILCCSWPDNVILVLLGLFSFLPMMHIGELSTERCLIVWLVANVIFGFYAALLLTKTLFVQNLLKCEVATDHPGRRTIFSISIVIVQLIILITSAILGFPPSTKFACCPRGLVTLCDIQGNIGILLSMAFNCLLLVSLCVLAILETMKQRRNFCRTENLIGVAVVGLTSYICSIMIAYFNIEVKNYLVVTLIHCVLYLVNPVVCIALIYVPTVRLVSTWLRQHIRQKRNLTSIKRAQVMSAKRQSVGPLADSLFNVNFCPDQTVVPTRQSGYYFDLRPASPVGDMSYPTSLVRSVHEPTHVVFGYGRCGTISVNESTGFQTETSMDELETLSCGQSRDSCYDNVSSTLPREDTTCEPSEELLHEITTYWEERERDNNVFINEQCERNIELAVEETDKWPSLERLKASDL